MASVIHTHGDVKISGYSNLEFSKEAWSETEICNHFILEWYIYTIHVQGVRAHREERVLRKECWVPHGEEDEQDQPRGQRRND